VCSRSMRCQASIGWRQLRSEMLRGGSRAGRGRRGWETILICVCDGELPLRVCEITPAFKCEGLRAVGPSLISGRAFALARSLRRRPCWLPTPGTYVWIRTHRNLVPNLWHKFVRRFVRPCFHQIVQRARKRLVRNFQTGRRGRLQRRERESRAPFACTRPSSTPACSWCGFVVVDTVELRWARNPSAGAGCWRFFGAFSHHSFASGPLPFISH